MNKTATEMLRGLKMLELIDGLLAEKGIVPDVDCCVEDVEPRTADEEVSEEEEHISFENCDIAYRHWAIRGDYILEWRMHFPTPDLDLPDGRNADATMKVMAMLVVSVDEIMTQNARVVMNLEYDARTELWRCGGVATKETVGIDVEPGGYAENACSREVALEKLQEIIVAFLAVPAGEHPTVAAKPKHKTQASSLN